MCRPVSTGVRLTLISILQQCEVLAKVVSQINARYKSSSENIDCLVEDWDIYESVSAWFPQQPARQSQLAK